MRDVAALVRLARWALPMVVSETTTSAVNQTGRRASCFDLKQDKSVQPTVMA
jgi:hypothetical protein